MALNRVRISLCSAETVVSRLLNSLDAEEVELVLESETVSVPSAEALEEAVVAVVAVVLVTAVLVLAAVELEEVVSVLVLSLALLELVDALVSAFRSALVSCTVEICIGNGPFTKGSTQLESAQSELSLGA